MQHRIGWKSAAMIRRYTKNSTCLKYGVAVHLGLESWGSSRQESKQDSYFSAPMKERKNCQKT